MLLSAFTQVDGVAMGSPLGTSLANAFLCHHETKWLHDCSDKSLYPQGSQPGIMYGSSKIRKPLVNSFPKLRPILSALNTGTYKWAKFFVPLLRHLTSNEFTLKNSFEFAKIICEQDTGLLMASLVVDSLFTNVPLEETINICNIC